MNLGAEVEKVLPLRGDARVDGVVAILNVMLGEGRTRKQIVDEFQALALNFRALGRNDDDEFILDMLDYICGWYGDVNWLLNLDVNTKP